MSTNRTRKGRLVAGAIALAATVPLLAGCPASSTPSDGTTSGPAMEEPTDSLTNG